MHIHRKTLLFPAAVFSFPYPHLLPLHICNKNIFCGAFSASEFSIFAIFMIFFQRGRWLWLWLRFVCGESVWQGWGWGLAKRLAHVYFTLQFRLRCISHSLLSSLPCKPPPRSFWPALRSRHLLTSLHGM